MAPPTPDAIFEELLRGGGPGVATDAVGRALVEGLPPRAFITHAVRSVWEEWSKPRQRRLLSMAVREVGSSSEARAQLLASVGELKQKLGAVLARWIADGTIRRGRVDGEHLAFELFGLLALVRILYLNARSSADDRRLANTLVERHLTFFTDSLFQNEQRNSP